MTYDCFPLGEVASLQAGYGFPVELQGRANGDYPFAKVGDISRCGRSSSSVLASAAHFIDEEDVVTLRAKLIPKGSVLFAKIGEAIRQNHRVVAGRAMLIDNNAMAAIPGTRIDSRFLYHYLKTVDFYRLAPATTVPALRKSDLEKLPIPIPPLSEQRRIAAILDKADSLRAKRREALAQMDSLAHSIFVEMFGDVLSKAERTALGTLVDEFRYGTSNKSGATGYPALRIPNVVGGSLDLADLKTVDVDSAELARLKLIDGDLLFVRTNGNPDYVGRCSVFSKSLVASTGHDASSFIYASYLIRARLKDDRLLPTVLQFYLSTAEGRREMRSYSKTSAGQFNINTEGLGALRIPKFPMTLQKAFVARLASIEKQRDVLKASAIEFDALFSSLQHRAFHGEL